MTTLSEFSKSLTKEWHPIKNGDIKPENIDCHSDKRVWWKCSRRGHEWDETVANRVSGRGCPYCGTLSGFHTIPGVNDFETLNPEVAKQWHPTKNGCITPKDITYKCNKKFWWICEKGHEWQAQANARSLGTRCPYCSNKKLLVGYNDFATLFPDLLDSWHPTKNGDLKPQDILGRAHTKIWWFMPYDDPQSGKHFDFEWESTVQSRVASRQCPFLANKRVWRGFNDLATRNPELIKEWHTEKNGSITPYDVVAGSSKYAWWKCERGHEWKASIYNRSKGVGCAKCAAYDRMYNRENDGFFLSRGVK